MNSILREIDDKASMKDMVINLIHNIKFYVKNREELVDLPYTNEFLQDYIAKLEEVLVLYENNLVPEWFKDYKAYLFTSGQFPYVKAIFPWLFSFKEFVDVLLSGEGEIIDDDGIIINNESLSYETWKEKFVCENNLY